MTAFVTGAPKNRSALRLSWRRMKAEISGGVKVLSPSLMRSTSPGCRSSARRNGKQLQLLLDIFDAAPHQALDRVDGALGSLDQILARRVADDDLIVARRAPPPTAPGSARPRPESRQGVSPCMNATREFVVPRSIPTMRSVGIRTNWPSVLPVWRAAVQ